MGGHVEPGRMGGASGSTLMEFQRVGSSLSSGIAVVQVYRWVSSSSTPRTPRTSTATSWIVHVAIPSVGDRSAISVWGAKSTVRRKGGRGAIITWGDRSAISIRRAGVRIWVGGA